MSKKQTVLFLCTGNTARSQMAAGLLRRLAGDRFEPLSAGMEPKSEIHPLAVKAMDEIGIDIRNQHPKGIEQFLGKTFISHLIVVCEKAQQTCPRIWPGLQDENRHDWPFDDPARAEGSEAERLAVFRRVRDEIKTKLEAWLSTFA